MHATDAIDASADRENNHRYHFTLRAHGASYRNVPNCSEMFRNVPKCSKMFRTVPKCSEMFQNVLFKNVLLAY